MYAIPVIKGKKSEKEKFAGADYTLTVEAFLPSGKAAQGATSHALGQKFSKAFNIKFLDKNEKQQHVWQTSWGISTRSIGVAIMMHSDDKGLVLSPRVADPQIIIIPIYNKKSEEALVLKKAEEIKNNLSDSRVEIDKSDETPGFKFNEWEMKGIPLRIEIGPRDIAKSQTVFVRRDTGEKKNIKITQIKNQAKKTLEDIHNSLYKKAENHLKQNTVEVKNLNELIKAIKNKKLAKTFWDGTTKSEDWIKDKTGGAKVICIIEGPLKPNAKCVYSGKKAKHVVYIGKSY
jgi:prolyl-tRNA synthetase